MEAPLDNFLGFERAPRTDAERKQVADMVSALNAADTLFVPDPKAGCRLSQVTLDLRCSVLARGEHAGRGSEPPRPGTAAHEEHADIDVDIVFTCAKAPLRASDRRAGCSTPSSAFAPSMPRWPAIRASSSAA